MAMANRNRITTAAVAACLTLLTGVRATARDLPGYSGSQLVNPAATPPRQDIAVRPPQPGLDPGCRAAYFRCADPPWGETVNEAAMDDVFATDWDEFTFESNDRTPFTSGGYDLVFMEGSDTCAAEMAAYIQAYNADIESFVIGGGAVWQNAAPNSGSGFALSFGATLDFGSNANIQVSWLDAGHAIHNGPFQPMTPNLTGGSYSHATIGGQSGTELQHGNNSFGVVLSEKFVGAGLIIYSGQTTTNFHNPQLEASNLRRNILEYLDAHGACQAAPALGPLSIPLYALLAMGGGLLARRRR